MNAADRPILPVRPRHRVILMRLDGWLRELRNDPMLRRRLRGDARAVFAGRGFAADGLPDTLPAPRATDVLLTHGQLFGLQLSPPIAEPGLELRLLSYGLKPLVLVHGSNDELSATLAWAEGRGFTALLSAYEWDRGVDKGKGGYSNLATNMRRATGDAQAWRSMLVGADEDTTVLGWLALSLGWDELLGRLLGYPACCASAFARRWTLAVESHQGDVVTSCIDDSGPGPHDWRVNNLGRYFGVELIQHFPCSFGCAPSRAAAARAAATLAEWESMTHAYTRTVLAAPVVYTEADGVAVLVGAEVGAGAAGPLVRYDPAQLLVTEPDGALHAMLFGANAVDSRAGGHQLDIGGHTVTGRLVLFADLSAA